MPDETLDEGQMELRAELPPRILRATFGIEGVPFSQVRYYDGDEVDRVMQIARALFDAYGETFPDRAPASAGPVSPPTHAPQTPSRAVQRGSGQSEHQYPVRVFCGKGHEGVEMVPSARNKTMDETEWGLIPASWMHRDGDRWCSCYLSQAVVEPK